MQPGTLSGSNGSRMIQHSIVNALGFPLWFPVKLMFVASLVALRAGIALHDRFRLC